MRLSALFSVFSVFYIDSNQLDPLQKDNGMFAVLANSHANFLANIFLNFYIKRQTGCCNRQQPLIQELEIDVQQLR